MPKYRDRYAKGLTLIELMTAAAIIPIMGFGIAIVLADSQRGWNAMYNRIYSHVVTDSHVARRMFDAVIRKSSSQSYVLDGGGTSVETYYYSDPNVPFLDGYACFFVAGNHLYVEYGQLNPKQTTNIETICGNVASCVFRANGRSVQMFLTLDNGSQRITTVTSAVMHN